MSYIWIWKNESIIVKCSYEYSNYIYIILDVVCVEYIVEKMKVAIS